MQTDISRLGFGGAGLTDALPKVLAGLQGLNVSVVAGAAANTAIPMAISAEDTVTAVVDITTPANVDPTHVTIANGKASGTITLLTTLVGHDTVVVNGKTYTFIEMAVTPSTNVGPQIIPITVTPSGIDVNAVGARFAQVLMSSDNGLSAANLNGVVTITWRTPGTVGNAITLSVAGANSHATRSGATLTGGTATQSIKISDSTAGKNLLVFWFNERP